jgi:hypothetical protein
LIRRTDMQMPRHFQALLSILRRRARLSPIADMPMAGQPRSRHRPSA